MSVTDRPGRSCRGAVQILLLLALLAGLGAFGFIECSAQPGFCTNCHNMHALL